MSEEKIQFSWFEFKKICGKKRKHRHKRHAWTHLNSLVANGKRGPFTVYRCPICGFFHVGHRSRRFQAA